MFAYVVRRVLATIPVMAVVALFVFSLLYIAPGDPAAVIAGDQATPADVERIRQSLGLDRPFLVRFGEWVWQHPARRLGTSIFTNLPVTAHDRAARRADPVADGADAACSRSRSPCRWAWSRPGSRAPGSTARVMAFAVLGFSVPVFVVGYLLAYVFALELDWLPVQGYTPISRRPLALAREPDPAGDRAGLRLYRADRPHHPRRDAGGAAAGLHPHRARQGRRADAASCSCTR